MLTVKYVSNDLHLFKKYIYLSLNLITEIEYSVIFFKKYKKVKLTNVTHSTIGV